MRAPPTSAWDAQGNIFVPDGYINHRVVKYDKNGRFIRQVGSHLRGTEPYQFNTPHSIAVDAQGNVYVADRGNARIQVFDNNLVLRAIYDNVGNPWEVCISPGPHPYLFSSNSNPDANPAASWETSGEIYKMELDGRIVGKFGKAGKAVGQFQTVHGIDCRNPDELVVSEISAWRVQKIRLRQTTHDIEPVREDSMRRLLSIALVAAALALGGTLSAQLNFPEIPYDAVEPLTLPAEHPPG